MKWWQVGLQGLIALVPIAVAYLAYKQSTRANKITAESAERVAEQNAALEQSKVDAEAYNRAKTFYEAALSQLEKQLDRLQSQFDRVTAQLASEQETSSTLRLSVSTLQRQLTELEQIVATLRRQLINAGLTPLPAGPVVSSQKEGSE